MSGSGYTHCACADCFEIAVSNDSDDPDYCNECEEAGCDGGECQATHAYCGDAGEIEVDGKPVCAECGEEF